jgi:hypothetical protein
MNREEKIQEIFEFIKNFENIEDYVRGLSKSGVINQLAIFGIRVNTTYDHGVCILKTLYNSILERENRNMKL